MRLVVVTLNFGLKNGAATLLHSWQQPLLGHSKYYFSNAREKCFCFFYSVISSNTKGTAARAIFEVDIVNWVALVGRCCLDYLVEVSCPFSTNSCFARELVVQALQCLFWYPGLVMEITAVRGRASLSTC